jgi:hypothetical protein
MTPYKEDIFREIEAVLAKAAPEDIELLLNDIACGHFDETAETRAGTNDNHCNVTNIKELAQQRLDRDASSRKVSDQLSEVSYNERRAEHSA